MPIVGRSFVVFECMANNRWHRMVKDGSGKTFALSPHYGDNALGRI